MKFPFSSFLHLGTPLPPPSSYSPAPMIRSKTSHGIGQSQQGGTTFSAPGSPMSNAPKGPPTRMIARSPSSAKEMLLIWVQQRVNTYPVNYRQTKRLSMPNKIYYLIYIEQNEKRIILHFLIFVGNECYKLLILLE